MSNENKFPLKKTSEPVPTGTLRQEMLPARVHAWVSLTLCPDVLSLSLSLSSAAALGARPLRLSRSLPQARRSRLT
jgi:hypothetical protein